MCLMPALAVPTFVESIPSLLFLLHAVPKIAESNPIHFLLEAVLTCVEYEPYSFTSQTVPMKFVE